MLLLALKQSETNLTCTPLQVIFRHVYKNNMNLSYLINAVLIVNFAVTLRGCTSSDRNVCNLHVFIKISE